ncbi:MAG: Ig-like domain-containing protein, partial [Chloroflexota bacterium]
MSKQRLFQLILLSLLLPLILMACRREEEATETPAPTPTTEVVAQPTNTPRPTAVPTQPPITAIDPAQIDWAPQVIYSSPAPGEEVVLDGAITIRFDQPMDQASVEAAFAIEPADSTRAVQGQLSWPRPDTLVFTPSGQFEREQRYRVRIGDAAKGRNGKPLLAPVGLDLKTVGFLEVGQVIPGDGLGEVQTDAAVTVLFNRPVVPLVSTG